MDLTGCQINTDGCVGFYIARLEVKKGAPRAHVASLVVEQGQLASYVPWDKQDAGTGRRVGRESRAETRRNSVAISQPTLRSLTVQPEPSRSRLQTFNCASTRLRTRFFRSHLPQSRRAVLVVEGRGG